jgi:hypothetical protein
MGRLNAMGATGLERLEALFEDGGRGLSALREVLAGLLGSEARVLGCESLAARVGRLAVETAGEKRSLIVKQLDPVVGHRNRMLAERWLPAVGLEELGPGLLACAAESTGRSAWQLYQDWGQAGLDHAPSVSARVLAAARAIGELHARFADHAVLGECRLWGGDLGRAFYGSNARDALRALAALDAAEHALPEPVEHARRRLVDWLQQMLDEEVDRQRVLDEHGGPETLVHGDLWPMNVFVLGSDDQPHVRLIDWDHVGVARPTYDLSTLLMRFPSEQHGEILASYRDAVAPCGWTIPDVETLNAMFDSEERARIGSQIVWPALALVRGDDSLRDCALETLQAVSDWFEQLGPVLRVERANEALARG